MAFGVELDKRAYKLRLARYKALAEAVASFVKKNEPDGHRFALLDVGVGRGRSMWYIDAEGVSDRIDFHGIELHQYMLDRIKTPERWKLFLGDIEKGLPFEKNSFDIILCEQILEHLNNPAAVLHEIARVLCLDGLLILGVPIFPPILSHLRRLSVRASTLLFQTKHEHAQSFDLRSVKRLILSTGQFTITDLYGCRVASGILIARLENYRWWYLFNRFLGRIAPAFCTEIQILARSNST